MATEDITKRLDHLNEMTPRLRGLAPLTFWTTFVYASLNFLIGISLFTQIDAHRISAALLIVNDILSYQFWGIVFFALGIGKYYGLYANKWNLTKRLMLTGVAVKAAWAISLIVRAFVSPGTVLVALLWVALAVIQVFIVIFFVPSLHIEKQLEEGKPDGRA